MPSQARRRVVAALCLATLVPGLAYAGGHEEAQPGRVRKVLGGIKTAASFPGRQTKAGIKAAYERGRGAKNAAGATRLAGRLAAAEGPVRLGRGRTELTAEHLRGVHDVLTSMWEGAGELHVVGEDGKRTKMSKADLADAQDITASALSALSDRGVVLDGSKSLSELLNHDAVAHATFKHIGADPKVAALRYKRAVRAVQELEKHNQVFLHLPGTKGQGKLAGVARLLGAEDKAFAIVIPTRTSDKVMESVLTMQGYFDGPVRPWLDPILEGKQGSSERVIQGLKARIAARRARIVAVGKTVGEELERTDLDAEERTALESHRDKITAMVKAMDETSPEELVGEVENYRDNHAVQLVGVDGNSTNAKFVQQRLRRASVKPVLLKDYYHRSSTAEGAFGVVAIASGLGLGLDTIAHAANSDMLKTATPWVVDLIDELGNGILSHREIAHQIAEIEDPKQRAEEKSQARKYLIGATAFGTALVGALAVKLPGGESLLQIAQNLHDPAQMRAIAGAVYGVASSGSGLFMATVASKRYIPKMKALVEDGIIAPPTDKRGNPLQGKALHAWAKKVSRAEHRQYTAQQGAIFGAVSSGLLGAAFGASGIMAHETAAGGEVEGLRRFGRIGAFVATGAGEGFTSATWQKLRPWMQTRKIRASNQNAVWGLGRRADRRLAEEAAAAAEAE